MPDGEATTSREGGEIWVGLAHVTPIKPIKRRRGGYVLVASFAWSEEDFRERVGRVMEALEAALTAMEDVETWAQRRHRCEIPPPLLELVEGAAKEPGVHYGTFHWYARDE